MIKISSHILLTRFTYRWSVTVILKVDEDAISRRMVLVCGTSTCHMAVSRTKLFIPGVWGPFWSGTPPLCNVPLVSSNYFCTNGGNDTIKIYCYLLPTKDGDNYQDLGVMCICIVEMFLLMLTSCIRITYDYILGSAFS